MNKLALFNVFLMASIGFTGCNQSSSDTSTSIKPVDSGFAIIDLDEIARQLGSDKQIVTAIKQREAALNSKLSKIAQSYTAELNRQKEALAEDGSANEGSVQLASYQQQANQGFQSAKTQAQQNLAQHRSQLISKFREAVRPAARKIADQRGLAIIVTKQDSLLYDYDDRCDITNDVVRLLKTSASKPSSAPQTTSNQASSSN